MPWLEGDYLTPANLNNKLPSSLAVNISDASFNAASGESSNTSIQLAIDVVEAAGGGTVWVAQGTYYFNNLKLGNRVCLRGHPGGGSILKLSDNLSGLTLGTHYGLGYKSSITECHLADLEIDGNEANNRSWDSEGIAFGTLRTGNVDFTKNFADDDNGTPPKLVTIQNVYSHDAVRNCFAFGGAMSIQCEMVRAKNSATDHLYYFTNSSSDLRAQVESAIAEGYARGAMIVSQGVQWGDLLVRSIASNPTTTYANTVRRVVECDADGSGRPTAIGSLSVLDYDPDVGTSDPLCVVGWQGSVQIGRLYVEQSSAASASVSAARIVFGDSTINSQGTSSVCVIGSLHLKNVNATGLQILRGTLDFHQFALGGGLVEYADSSASSTAQALFRVTRTGTVKVQSLTMSGKGQRLCEGESGRSTRFIFDAISMMDGCEATDFISMPSNSGSVVVRDSRFTTTDMTGVSLAQTHFQNCMIGGQPTNASGTTQFDGDGSKKSFDITHGLWKAPTRWNVVPGHADASGDHYVNITSNTLIRLAYTTDPGAGTSNVSVYWEAAVSPVQVQDVLP